MLRATPQVHAGPAKFEFGDDEFVDWVDGQAGIREQKVHGNFPAWSFLKVGLKGAENDTWHVEGFLCPFRRFMAEWH